MLKANPNLGGKAENEAKKIMGRRYSGMGWVDLYLVKGHWEEHHIKPVNWGGGNENSNLIFIRNPEHSKITTFWNKLKSTIMEAIRGRGGRR